MPIPRASLPLPLIRPVAAFTLIAALVTPASAQEPTLTIGGKAVSGWKVSGERHLARAAKEGDLEVRVLDETAPFNSVGWSVPFEMPRGKWRMEMGVRGDAGSSLFLGLRAGGVTLGKDQWMKLDGSPQRVSYQFHAGPSNRPAALILGLGMKENAGKTLRLSAIRLEAVLPPSFPEIPEKEATDALLSPGAPPLPFRPEVLGHNLSAIAWQGTVRSPAFLWDTERQKPNENWKDLVNAFPLYLMRFHWGNEFPWRDAIGPLAERKPVRHDLWNEFYGTRAGFDEFLGWLDGLPGRPKATIIASPLRPVQELADLVAYLNASSGPMAELRKKNGHPEPFGVKFWELGNETDWRNRKDLDVMRTETAEEKAKRRTFTVEEYIARCRERILAMRAVDPTIRFYPHAQTSPWFHLPAEAYKAEWHREVVRELGPLIDGIAVHPYYDGYTVTDCLKDVDLILEDIERLKPPGRKLTVWVSEHAKWVNYEKEEERPQSWGLGGAVSTADFLMRLLARPGVEAANYWCYEKSGPWRLLGDDAQDGGSRRFPTSIHHAYRLLHLTALATVRPLSVQTSGESPKGYTYTLTALAFEGPGKRSLVVANRSEDRPFLVRPPAGMAFPPSAQQAVLTAKSFRASPVSDDPDAVACTEGRASLGADARGRFWRVPPRCLATLVWAVE